MSDSETNGNVVVSTGKYSERKTASSEDVSEYTDADESISAPTEFLAEFLSAVMLKDYATALKYCKLILQYEPNNVTAKEFQPLIIEKLQMRESNHITADHMMHCKGLDPLVQQERNLVKMYWEARKNEAKDPWRVFGVLCVVYSQKNPAEAPLFLMWSSLKEADESDSEEISESESSSSYSCTSSDDSEGNEEKPTDSDATTGSYSSLEDDDVENIIGCKPSDVTNGNAKGNVGSRTRNHEVLLTQAIKKKLDIKAQNRNLSLAANSPRIPEIWSPDDRPNLWEDRNCVKELQSWDEKSPESEGSFGQLGFPFSSDSESLTDPNSQLVTVHEILKNNNSF